MTAQALDDQFLKQGAEWEAWTKWQNAIDRQSIAQEKFDGASGQLQEAERAYYTAQYNLENSYNDPKMYEEAKHMYDDAKAHFDQVTKDEEDSRLELEGFDLQGLEDEYNRLKGEREEHANEMRGYGLEIPEFDAATMTPEMPEVPEEQQEQAAN